MRNRNTIYLAASLLLISLCTTTALAVTESEVQAQVSAIGREAVTGNIFIWFLCAIAFLKISQKIDSFMASLGIHVGNTGGSMVAELMLAGRAISGVMGGRGFGRQRSGAAASGGTGNPMSGGLAGMVGRKMQGGAVSGATDATAATKSGGIMAGIGAKLFQSSLSKGGDYANNVIGAVAKGNINQMGSITGDKAATALKSYMNVGGPENNWTVTSPDTQSPLVGGEAMAAAQAAPFADHSPDLAAPQVPSQNGAAPSADAMSGHSQIPVSQNSGESVAPQLGIAPSFADVEIGGGRITGYEAAADGGAARQFAMYSADQYMQPDGGHDVVSAIDGSKWYRQYAQPAVERTPYRDEAGMISYDEKIVQKMPPVPRRKDRA